MPGMTLRDFECTLCGEPVKLVAGDLYVPEPRICDACLKVVWDMDDAALTAHVNGRLPDDADVPADSVVRLIERDREYWKSVDVVIAHREQAREAWRASTAPGE